MSERANDGADRSERRQAVEAEVRAWCSALRLPGHRASLSDTAAIAIAAGRVSEPIRRVLGARRRAGRQLPAIGGFGALRAMVDERDRLQSPEASRRRGAALVNRVRTAELTKRIDHLRTASVMSNRHFATGVRSVRRERREGLHLDLDQRDELFDALARTPEPIRPGFVVKRGLTLMDAAADKLTEYGRRTPVGEHVERAVGIVDQYVDQKDDRFVDRYDTLLFLAGSSYDRIDSSPSWKSPYFEIQRSQLDLTDELTQISVDTNSLRNLAHDLDRIDGTMVDADTRAQVASRRESLEVVWEQLMERVAALIRVADLVEASEDDVRTSDAMARARSLDDRIDDLVGRSGDREISADNTHSVGDQVYERQRWKD